MLKVMFRLALIRGMQRTVAKSDTCQVLKGNFINYSSNLGVT